MYKLEDLNYLYYGNGNNTIVLLHGWMQNIQMMRPIGDRLQKKNKILIVDLPGMGKSIEPDFIMSIDDYVDLIHELIIKLEIENPILIGHSFGGKISIQYASKYDVKKLVLLASPFCPEQTKLTLKQKFYKQIKKIKILKPLEEYVKGHIGSTDYRNASSTMRDILVKSINTDFTDSAKKIECPTIMIWGDKDTAVPLNRAYELENIIQDSAVIVYPNCTHYAYLENIDQTVSIINSFVGGK